MPGIQTVITEVLAKRRARRLFPAKKEAYWYCISFNEYQYSLMKQGLPFKSADIELPCETFLINPFYDHGRITEGAILACMKVDGWVGYYLITKIEGPGSWADLLPWDDGTKADLVLHHVERAG